MFHVNPTDEQIRHAVWIASDPNFNHHVFGGEFKHKYHGFLTQTIMADLLGVPRPIPGNDGGHDFVVGGVSVDLKTIVGTVPRKSTWPHNLALVQYRKHDVDVYMLASINSEDGIVAFDGYIPKREIKVDEWLFVKGTKRPQANGKSMTTTCDTIEIPASAVHGIRSIKDFVDAMQTLDFHA